MIENKLGNVITVPLSIEGHRVIGKFYDSVERMAISYSTPGADYDSAVNNFHKELANVATFISELENSKLPANFEQAVEAIARLIDPVSFSCTPSSYGLADDDTDGFHRTMAYGARLGAIDKAKTILAALPMFGTGR